MIKLSVNINKIATLRNSRGSGIPDLLKIALDVQKFGGDGITVHPRPDERHITYKDVYNIKKIINSYNKDNNNKKSKKEFNVEGNPIDKFMELVLNVKPDQVTLVPDKENTLTSNSGWNTKIYWKFLYKKIQKLKKSGIRTSIFLNPDPEMIPYAFKSGTDRIELYTGIYSSEYEKKNYSCIKGYIETAKLAKKYGISINAGHDLNLKNVSFFVKRVPEIKELSIGHALISDSLYMGLEKTIKFYLKKIYFL